MDVLNLIQSPAMVVTVTASWLVAPTVEDIRGAIKSRTDAKKAG